MRHNISTTNFIDVCERFSFSTR